MKPALDQAELISVEYSPGGKEEPKKSSELPSFHRSSRQPSPGPVGHLRLSHSSQSPEPPPRLNRFPSQGQECGSPLPLKRGFLDHSPIRRGLVEGSPSLSRRYNHIKSFT